MKRVFWTVGVGLAALFIGGHAGGRVGLIIGLIWGACIGSGFGAIFTQTMRAKTFSSILGGDSNVGGTFFRRCGLRRA